MTHTIFQSIFGEVQLSKRWGTQEGAAVAGSVAEDSIHLDYGLPDKNYSVGYLDCPK